MSFGIWNNIDELALYLGATRLPREDDDSFKDRIYRLSRFMYKPDSYNQLQASAAQCGLDVKGVIQIDSAVDFICNIDYDYFTLETETEYLRVFIGRDDITLGEVIEGLSKINSIEVIPYSNSIASIPMKFIIKNTNLKITQEFMPENKLILKNKNIQNGSIEFEDKPNFSIEKDSLGTIANKGDYFIDYKNGYIESKDISIDGQIVKYKYIEKPFVIEYSELALTPINRYFKHGITKDNVKYIQFLLNNNVWAK